MCTQKQFMQHKHAYTAACKYTSRYAKHTHAQYATITGPVRRAWTMVFLLTAATIATLLYSILIPLPLHYMCCVQYCSPTTVYNKYCVFLTDFYQLSFQIRVGQEWDQSGTRGDYSGTIVGLEWDQSGTRVRLEWDQSVNQSGTRVGLEWDQSETRVDQSGTKVGLEQDQSVV